MIAFNRESSPWFLRQRETRLRCVKILLETENMWSKLTQIWSWNILIFSKMTASKFWSQALSNYVLKDSSSLASRLPALFKQVLKTCSSKVQLIRLTHSRDKDTFRFNLPKLTPRISCTKLMSQNTTSWNKSKNSPRPKRKALNFTCAVTKAPRRI